MNILTNLKEGVFKNDFTNREDTKESVLYEEKTYPAIERNEPIEAFKRDNLFAWARLINYWSQWKKLFKEYESQFSQEMNELERKAYEQYNVLPVELKKHFMEK